MECNTRPKIAVIGLGSIGLRHAKNFLANRAAVCGFDPDALRGALLVEAGGTLCPSRAAALDGADAAVIASPPSMHLADIEAGLRAGCHLFVEKPFAPVSQGLKELLDAAESNSLVVFAALNLRFHPAVQAARQFIQTGVIGRPLWARFIVSSYLPDWRPHQDYRRGYASDPANGGIALDMIHEIDLAHHLLGSLNVAGAAMARTGLLDIGGPDVADIQLHAENGTQVTIHLDYVTRRRRRRAEIAGDRGLIEIDLDARKLTRFQPDGACAEEQTFAGSYGEDYVAEAKLFLECIAGRASPLCDGVEALAVLSLAIAARDAAVVSAA